MEQPQVETILRPNTETERNRALLALWKEVAEDGREIPAALHDFLRHHRTTDWTQSALIGLLLWKLEGSPQPVPPYILVRVFPGLFADEDPEVADASAELFKGLTALDFFKSTSNRSLFDEEQDEDEQWYGSRILGNYTREISEAYDRRSNAT